MRWEGHGLVFTDCFNAFRVRFYTKSWVQGNLQNTLDYCWTKEDSSHSDTSVGVNECQNLIVIDILARKTEKGSHSNLLS